MEQLGDFRVSIFRDLENLLFFLASSDKGTGGELENVMYDSLQVLVCAGILVFVWLERT